MNIVRIRVTGSMVGVGLVFPYDHTGNPSELPLYRVPLYEVRVNESSVYKAVRFGYRGQFERPWDPHRQCDEGIIAQREVAAEWNGVYLPHTVDDKGSPGGFRIRSDQVYLHQGATIGGASGTLGCIEIESDHEADDWERFLATVRRDAGAGYVGAAVKAKKVFVTVEAAARPAGLLVGRFSPATANSTQPDLLKDWKTATVPWSPR